MIAPAAAFRLDTSFGGGKTHGLIALVHAARGMRGVADPSEFVDPALLPAEGVRAGIVAKGDVIGATGPGRTILAITVDNKLIDELVALATEEVDCEPETVDDLGSMTATGLCQDDPLPFHDDEPRALPIVACSWVRSCVRSTPRIAPRRL